MDRKGFKLNHLLLVILVKFDGIHLPDQEIMKEVDENGYTYFGILELDEIKEHEMKVKVTAEYERRLKLILKSN